jgi:phytanoyl-CoA dioxygenase PhyH
VTPLFEPYRFDARDRAALDRDGHLVLPGILTESARSELILALGHVLEYGYSPDGPHMFAAEHAPYLATLIAHPQMLELARAVLGGGRKPIRYDHCVALSRKPAFSGMRWHAHEYADDDPELGFIRIFFYVNGFAADDGGLKVVPGSHLLRDSKAEAQTDAELAEAWLRGKVHPLTGEPLRMQTLSAPAGSVILMWTHALHGVVQRKAESDTRWTVVYAYRNPGRPSRARRITEAFEREAEAWAGPGLLSLY